MKMGGDSVLNSQPARPAALGGCGLIKKPGWLFRLIKKPARLFGLQPTMTTNTTTVM
jgi:hypothetical protein